jgi:hypothetical protein
MQAPDQVRGTRAELSDEPQQFAFRATRMSISHTNREDLARRIPQLGLILEQLLRGAYSATGGTFQEVINSAEGICKETRQELHRYRIIRNSVVHELESKQVSAENEAFGRHLLERLTNQLPRRQTGSLKQNSALPSIADPLPMMEVRSITWGWWSWGPTSGIEIKARLLVRNIAGVQCEFVTGWYGRARSHVVAEGWFPYTKNGWDSGPPRLDVTRQEFAPVSGEDECILSCKSVRPLPEPDDDSSVMDLHVEVRRCADRASLIGTWVLPYDVWSDTYAGSVQDNPRGWLNFRRNV